MANMFGQGRNHVLGLEKAIFPVARLVPAPYRQRHRLLLQDEELVRQATVESTSMFARRAG